MRKYLQIANFRVLAIKLNNDPFKLREQSLILVLILVLIDKKIKLYTCISTWSLSRSSNSFPFSHSSSSFCSNLLIRQLAAYPRFFRVRRLNKIFQGLFIKFLDCLDFTVSQRLGLRFYLTNLFLLFCSPRHVSSLKYKRLIDKIRLDFCARACTSWFQ